jgi:hypothetical protein
VGVKDHTRSPNGLLYTLHHSLITTRLKTNLRQIERAVEEDGMHRIVQWMRQEQTHCVMEAAIVAATPDRALARS